MTQAPTALQMPTNEEIDAMSPDIAKAKLAELHSTYVAANKPEPAPETREPPRPLGADDKPIPLAPTGIASSAEMDRTRVEEGIAHLESRGFPPRTTEVGEDLWNMLKGSTPVSAELQAQAERKLASFEKSADWRKRFFDGEERTVREFHLATAIIAAGKAQRLNEF